MGRPKREPSIEDQLRIVITQALRQCKNELAKQLIDVLSIQQKSNADAIISELGNERNGGMRDGQVRVDHKARGGA